MDRLRLPVSEVFGAWQGEGPHTGRRCTFIRFGLCNLHCSWCDTAYTWDFDRYDVHDECPMMEPRDIAPMVEDLHGMVVLTGGEPLIHATNPALRKLLDLMPDAELHVETNGTLTPTGWLAQRVTHWSVSPKIAWQGDPIHRRIVPGALRALLDLPGAILKVVCRDAGEVREATKFCTDLLGIDVHRLWIMPEGVTPDEVLVTARGFAEAVGEAGANLTLRQHVLMYGIERKR